MRWSEEQYALYKQQSRSALELERDLQRDVMVTATQYGWLAYHTVNSKKSRSGFPDTVLVRGETCIFAELKMPGNALSPAQQAWLTALERVQHVETYLWLPDDRPLIAERLR
jgi:hypothetical protein